MEDEKVYYLVGRIIESVQSIEYNLIEGTKMAKILNVFNKYKNVSPFYFQKIEKETKELAEEMTNMTFGQLMGIISQYDVLPADDLEYLESLLSKRNQLVHKYFKYNELNKASDELKHKYLTRFLEESVAFQKYLDNLIVEMKKDLDNVIYS